MKKRLTSLVLLLAMLVSLVAVLPVASAAEGETKLAGTDVTLTDGVLLNFYVEADDALGIDNAELVNGYYKMTVELAAKEMGDKVVAQFKNGDDIVAEHTYSVKEYAAGILDGNYDAATKALVTAMLNYGAAAQKYFKYETDKLVGTPVTDTSALLAANVADVEVTDEAEIFAGASLVLDGTMKLRFYFLGNDLDVTIDGNAAPVVNVGTKACYADMAITPDNIDKVYEVKSGDTTVKYSALNYLKNKAEDAELSEIVASIYAYSTAADRYVLVQNCTHDDVPYIQLPTMFNKGVKSGYCANCEREVNVSVAKTEPEVEVVTTTKDNENSVIKSGMQLADVLKDGEHFYPIGDDKDGKDLLIEFSMLFSGSMDNFQGSNITFPGIYGAESLASDKGAPAFWYYIKAADGITAGKYDDWTSNAVNKNDPAKYYNKQEKAVEFDGWHRFGVRFHQNTNVDLANNEVSYTMTVTMYIDGVRVYEAELYAMNENKKANSHYLRLYTAEIVDGNVVYKDNVGAYASFYRYTAYVADANNPAYFVTADKHMSCGDDFLIDVDRVDDPEDATLKVNGAELDAKVYYNYEVEIPDVPGDDDEPPCTHAGVQYETIKLPTVFTKGVKSGHCELCGEDVEVEIEETKAEMNATTSTKYDGFISDVYSLNDVLAGGKHFYPHEENDNKGRDLYIEFSILLNDTMEMFNSNNMSFPGIYKTEAVNTSQGSPLHWFYIQQSGGYVPGSFELANSKTPNNKTPQAAEDYLVGGTCPGGTDTDENVIVDGLDGWHRFGIQYHFEAVANPGKSDATYLATATLYIDGVEVHKYVVKSVDSSSSGSNFLPIIWANGDLTSWDDYSSRYVCVYRFNDYLKSEYEGETAYLPIADVYVTAGDGFVLDVTPVENPEAQDFTQDGVSLSGKQYFKVN